MIWCYIITSSAHVAQMEAQLGRAPSPGGLRLLSPARRWERWMEGSSSPAPHEETTDEGEDEGGEKQPHLLRPHEAAEPRTGAGEASPGGDDADGDDDGGDEGTLD